MNQVRKPLCAIAFKQHAQSRPKNTFWQRLKPGKLSGPFGLILHKANLSYKEAQNKLVRDPDREHLVLARIA
jgi:hypothetical protein